MFSKPSEIFCGREQRLLFEVGMDTLVANSSDGKEEKNGKNKESNEIFSLPAAKRLYDALQKSTRLLAALPEGGFKGIARRTMAMIMVESGTSSPQTIKVDCDNPRLYMSIEARDAMLSILGITERELGAYVDRRQDATRPAFFLDRPLPFIWALNRAMEQEIERGKNKQ